jgi:hypothetical protein
MTEFYDLYLYEGCLRLPQPEDLQQDLESENEALVLFATTLFDSECREQLIMPEIAPGRFRRKHPGFLGLNLSEATATAVCEQFLTLSTRGRIIPARYRDPQVTIEQALQVAQKHLGPSYTDREGEIYSYGPIKYSTQMEETPMTWQVIAPLPGLQARGSIPGALFVSVDRIDGHIWSQQESQAFRKKAFRQHMRPLRFFFEEAEQLKGTDTESAGNGGFLSLDWWEKGLQQGPCIVSTYDPAQQRKNR